MYDGIRVLNTGLKVSNFRVIFDFTLGLETLP